MLIGSTAFPSRGCCPCPALHDSAAVASQTVILIGVILLTANTASTYYNWVIFYAFAQFIFGFGIGGEYPVRRS